jgi:hypothetical protein
MKSNFEYQGKTYKTFWNERDYSGTKYITVTAPTGGESKVTASPSKGISVGGSHSIDFAKAAYKSITGQDW